MAKKKKDKRPKVDGYSMGELSQLARRRMIQKDHGDKKKYKRNKKGE
jgi:hypothetical protein|tara:strand:- start:783 stop:923 length:141 start_codon:yes stop_codon:yes gene_type:complete